MASPGTMPRGSCGPRAANSSSSICARAKCGGGNSSRRRAKAARPPFGKWNRWAGENILCCGRTVRCRLVEIVAGQPGSAAAKASRLAIHTLAVARRRSKAPPPRAAVLRRSEAGATTRVALLPDGTISILRQVAAENLGGDQEVHSYRKRVARRFDRPTSASSAMDREGNTLYAGTKDGILARWQLKENGEVGPAGSGAGVSRPAGDHGPGPGLGRRFLGGGRRARRAFDLVSGQGRDRPPASPRSPTASARQRGAADSALRPQ